MNTPNIPPDPRSERINQAQPGPLLEPLIAKIIEVGRLLDELRDLAAAKTEEIKALYKAATLLTRKNAARQLAISESQLDREVTKGALQEVSIDRRPKFSLIDLEAYIAVRRTSRRKRRLPIKAPVCSCTYHRGADAPDSHEV